MRPRVTLQLPTARSGTASLRGADVLFVGEGYVARHLQLLLEADGATVRTTERATFDSDVTRRDFARASHVLLSVPPARDGREPTLDMLRGTKTEACWIGYLSATSVYGDRAGGWCFEGEAPTPGLDRGYRRADAELCWLESYASTHVFRLAGIYGPATEKAGPGRSPFSRLRDGTARVIDAPGHVVNRINVADIADALLRSMRAPVSGEIFNLADGHPAPPGDVLDHAAELLGVARPPRVALDDPSVSAMARSFYAETKRIDIGRAKARLGWQPRYRDYREGLAAVLAAERNS